MARLDEGIVRSLAAFRAERGLAVSCFLDLDPSVVPTPHELRAHVGSLVGEARRVAEEASGTLAHGDSQQLQRDVERIGSFLENELDRAGAHGIALFVSGAEDMWEEILLPRPVSDALHLGRSFVLAPLLESLERDREIVLAAVGRDRGTIWRSRGGQATVVEDRSRDGQGQHDQGGWSQSRYQRSVDREALGHMKDVAEAIGELVPQGSDTLLVVACAQEQRTTFEELLEPHVRDAMLGWADVEAHADVDAIQPHGERLLDERLASEREQLLESWREERGQRSGRAAASWEEALAAAWDGRVDSVLVDGRSREAWECPACGRGSPEAGTCVVDETRLEPARGGALELVIRGTLLHGGSVGFLPDEQLDETHGVAALLRYATVPAR